MSLRPCAVCHDTNHTVMHRQSFVCPDMDSALHYDVVSCDHCGFVFASDIPAQETLDAYYADSGHHLHVELPSGIQVIHAGMYEFIGKHTALSSEQSVLDIGSSMGHFLNYFRQDGFSRLTGIEPSAEAARLALEHYGIEVLSTAFKEFKPDRQFDLVTLCGVLEHLLEPDQTLEKINTLLTDQGYLFIAVPDADVFGSLDSDEPFLEFALEHINFFGYQSLVRLIENKGFEVIRCDSVHNEFYNNNYLYLIAQKAQKSSFSQHNVSSITRDSVCLYIQQSEQQLVTVQAMIDSLVESQEPVLVWGAGSLTRRLCASTRLAETRLSGFIDKNKELHGKRLSGSLIRPPDWLSDKTELTVLIASTTYAEEIRQTLLQQYGWQGRIVTIDQH